MNDEEHILLVNRDAIQIIRIADGIIIDSLRLDEFVQVIALSEDNSRLAIAFADSTIGIYSIRET